MTDSIDPEEIRRAFNDLSSGRVQELPLSGSGTKNPSYRPDGRNGTSHYSGRFKTDLKGLWNLSPSEQEPAPQQILGDGDARPWAKKFAAKFLEDHQAQVAPSFNFARKDTKKAFKRPITTANHQVGKLGGVLPPGAVTKFFPASKSDKKTTRYTHDRDQGNPPVTKLAGQAGGQTAVTKAPAVQPPIMPAVSGKSDKPSSNDDLSKTCHLQLVPPPQDASTAIYHAICMGVCEMVPSQPDTPNFLAKFQLRIHLRTNCAMLLLAAEDREERMHNVLDLEAPEMRGEHCFVNSRKSKGNAFYLLKLGSKTETGSFRFYLSSLQDTMLKHHDSEAAHSPQIESPKKLVAQERNPLAVNNVPAAPSVRSKESMTQPTEDVCESEKGVEELRSDAVDENMAVKGNGPLISIDDMRGQPEDATQSPPQDYDVEDAVEQLFKLVRDIVSEIIRSGVQVSDDMLRGVTEAALENWIACGFIGADDVETKDDMMNLLWGLVRLKLRTKSRKSTPAGPNMAALADLVEENTQQDVVRQPNNFQARSHARPHARPQPRSQYTAKEIESLKDRAAPRPDGLNNMILMTGWSQPSVNGLNASR